MMKVLLVIVSGMYKQQWNTEQDPENTGRI